MSRLALLPLLVSLGAAAQEDSVHQVARAYLDALTGAGDDAARESLLGGVTMNASIATIGSWRIVAEDPIRRETAPLQTASQLMSELDKAGRSTLASLINQSGALGNDVQVRELSEAEANKLLAPTKERASRFFRTLPVLAYVARVSKSVYWHPKNPIRPLLAQAGGDGTYTLEVHRFTIESLEGPRKGSPALAAAAPAVQHLEGPRHRVEGAPGVGLERRLTRHPRGPSLARCWLGWSSSRRAIRSRAVLGPMPKPRRRPSCSSTSGGFEPRIRSASCCSGPSRPGSTSSSSCLEERRWNARYASSCGPTLRRFGLKGGSEWVCTSACFETMRRSKGSPRPDACQV